VPLSPRLIQTAYHLGEDSQDSAVDDFTPVDFSVQPSVEEANLKAAKSMPSQEKLPEVMVAVDEDGGIAVPDFTGKTMREVTESCLRLGLDPVLVGSSLASQQTPAAGSKVRRGSKIIVEFGGSLAKPAKPGKQH